MCWDSLPETGGSADSRTYVSAVPCSAISVFCGSQTEYYTFHDSKYSFGIAVDPLTFQPKMHPTVTVGLETVFLLQTQLLCQGGVFLRPAQTLYMIVVAASGHAKEPAHSRYGILCLMTIDDLVFELRLHILSMSERNPAAIDSPSSTVCFPSGSLRAFVFFEACP